MDIYESLQEQAVPLMKKFIEKNVKTTEDLQYDILEEFNQLINNFSADVQSTIVKATVDGELDVSEKISQVFSLLFPDYTINKIEFLDSCERKNFISYEQGGE